MGLESTTTIEGLNSANPLGSDPKSQADDHLRLIKSVLKASFPRLSRAIFNTQDVTANYTVLATDFLATLVVKSNAVLTVPVSSLGTPFVFIVYTKNATATITPTGTTINGQASYALPPNNISFVISDGQALVTLTGLGANTFTGAQTVPNEPYVFSSWANDMSVPTKGAIAQVMGYLKTVFAFNGSATLDSDVWGSMVTFYGSTAGQTLTLPDLDPQNDGIAATLYFANLASTSVTLAANPTSPVDFFCIGTNTEATLVVPPGETIFLAAQGNGNLLRAIGGSLLAKYYDIPLDQVLVAQHQTNSGVDGGGITANTWTTRPLTNVQNTIPSASFPTSSRVSLPAGKYMISGYGILNDNGLHRARIQSVSGNSVTINGLSTNGIDGATTLSTIPEQLITLTATTVLELQHFSTVTQGINGLGAAVGSGTSEIYAAMTVRKI